MAVAVAVSRQERPGSEPRLISRTGDGDLEYLLLRNHDARRSGSSVWCEGAAKKKDPPQSTPTP